MRRAQALLAEVPAVGGRVAGHADRLGSGQHGAGTLDGGALDHAGAQLVKCGGQQGQHLRQHFGADALGDQLARHFLADQPGLCLDAVERAHGLEVEAALERGGHLVDPAVAQVGRGDDVEAGPGEQIRLHVLQFGDVQQPLGQHRHQAVLHLGDAAADFLEAQQAAAGHRPVQRPRHQRRRAGAVAQQQRVVPAVADLLLHHPGAALHGQRAVAADRRRQQLGEQRLGGTRLAHQHQPALAGQGDDGALDERVVAVDLACDASVAPAAEDEGAHRARTQAPALRARTVVGLAQRGKLLGVSQLGGQTLGRLRGFRGFRGSTGHQASPFGGAALAAIACNWPIRVACSGLGRSAGGMTRQRLFSSRWRVS
ncbi:hypothetical protein D3C80_922610 [compost metagenome]